MPGVVGGDAPESDDAEDPSAPLVLSPGARALFEALAEVNQALADMYLGALDIAARTGNPDRLALAAHGIRELIEKLPRYRDVPVDSKPPGPSERARRLVETWTRVREKLFDGDSLSKAGHKLIAAVAEFCEGVLADLPTRKEQAAAAVRGLDLNPIKLPPQIESLHAEEWREIERFFLGVSHHTHVCTDGEFAEHVAALERFLLNRLRPRTFDDFAVIDELLAEEPDDAQP